MIPNKCLSVRENLYLRKHVSPRKLHLSIRMNHGDGLQGSPRKTICSSALIGWALGSENTPANEARRLSSQSLLRFVHFSGRRVRRCLDLKRFPNGTCKLDFKHLPRRHTLSPVILF